MTDPEQLLSQTLHARGDAVDHDRTTMDAVVGGARGIRRRRRQRVGLVAAAVVAVVVPMALIAGPDPARTPGPAGSPSSTPTSTPTVTSTDPVPMSMSSLNVGKAPQIGYAEGHEFVDPDGSRHPIGLDTGIGITAITPYDSGLLVNDDRSFEGTVGGHLLDDRGREVGSWCTTSAPVVSGGLQTAYSTSVCGANGEAGGSMIRLSPCSCLPRPRVATQDVEGQARLVGILDGRVVFTGEFTGGAWITDLTSAPAAISGLDSVEAVNGTRGLVSGQSSADPTTGVVLNPDTGDELMTADATLGTFSPDGDHVLGLADEGDGPCCPVVYAVPPTSDGNAEPLSKVSDALTRLGVPDLPLVWEDDIHLLGVLTEGDRRTIVRIGLDGSLNRVSDIVPATADHDIVFATRP